MCKIFRSLLFLAVSFSAQAFPELYCVSTSGYGAITKISLFTNSSGTLTGGVEVTSQEGYFADVDSIVKLKDLKNDDAKRTIWNVSSSLTLVLDKKELTPTQASKYFVSYMDEEGHVGLVRGHKVGFTKYRLAKLTNFKISAKKDSWQESLNDAFSAGVNKYLCGDATDMIKN